MNECLRIVILGRSLRSSRNNRYLGAYRSLLREVFALGHDLLYLEPETNRETQDADLPRLYFCQLETYQGLDDLKATYAPELREADVVIVTSELENGKAIAEWALEIATGAVAYHDLNTPETLTTLMEGRSEQLDRTLVPRFDLYLASSAGPSIDILRGAFGARSVKTLYASFDQEIFYPQNLSPQWDLGYRGGFRSEEIAALDELLVRPARSCPGMEFTLSGASFPELPDWPENVAIFPPIRRAEQRRHYNLHRFFLSLAPICPNVAGFSPSARLFEAAACAIPVIAQAATGLESFLEPDREVLVARSSADVVNYLRTISPDQREEIGASARERMLREHTAVQRAAELEAVLCALLANKAPHAYLL